MTFNTLAVYNDAKWYKNEIYGRREQMKYPLSVQQMGNISYMRLDWLGACSWL